MIRHKNYKKETVLNLLAIIIGIVYLIWVYQFPVKLALFYFGILLSGYSAFGLINVLIQSHLVVSISYILLIGLVSGFAVIHAQNIHQYGDFVHDTIIAILQTDLKEITAYLGKFVPQKVIFEWIVWWTILTGSFLFRIRYNFFQLQMRWVRISYSVLIIIGLSISLINSTEFQFFIQEAVDYRKIMTRYKESRQDVINKYSLDQISSDFEGNIIVVIGESTSRHHMGLYNYFRNTTPFLDSISDSLIVFDDVISTHSHTIQSLSDALTLNDRQKYKNLLEIPDIITIAKTAGFRTTWLSNQNSIGVWDNPVIAMAREADEVQFHDSGIGKAFLRTSYDKDLVQSLKDRMNNQNSVRNIYFLHLMSTHFPYCGIIPEDFEPAQSPPFEIPVGPAVYGNFPNYWQQYPDASNRTQNYNKSIDCYDSAIRYLDFVLFDIFRWVQNINTPTLVIYLADHGEAPLIGSGHESRLHSHFHAEIPFFLYGNSVFRKKNESIYADMEEMKSVSVSLVDLSYSLIDLMKITGLDTENERSFFSRDFQPFPRTTLHREIPYDSYSPKGDNIERTRGVLKQIKLRYGQSGVDKIWPHRVNSLGKLLEINSLVKGVELDVVFDINDHEYHVYHPPAKDVGLSLSDYFRMDNDSLRYWLDWKNAKIENIPDVLTYLSQNISVKNFQQRVVIETQLVHESISLFSKAGWRTSYYLPTDKILSSLKLTATAEEAAKEIINNIGIGQFAAISFDIQVYEFFSTYLRDYCNRQSLEVYTWDITSRLDQIETLDKLKNVIEDSDIDILLLRFPSPFDQ